MSIIRTLIEKEWYRSFAGILGVLFLLLSVGNIVSGILRTRVTLLEVFLNHLLETPASMKLLVPISCLGASLLSIDELKSRNELTPIFASGYSRKRFILNILKVALLVSLVQFFISSYVEPFAKSQKSVFIKDGGLKFSNLKDQGLSSSTISSGKIWYKSGNYFLSFSTFDEKTKSLTNASLYFFNKDHKIFKKITAKQLINVKDSTWLITEGKEYSLLNGAGYPKIVIYKNKEVKINETSEELIQIKSDITTINIIQLYKYIKKLEAAGINTNEYKILFLEKISSSLLSVILAVLAAITAFNPNRKSSAFGKNLLFILSFTIVYWLLNTYLVELSKNSKLNPWLACFGPSFLFSAYLGFYFYRNRTLS